jgi:glycosyltransferase involved in cell wall biosynthesis
MRIAAVLSVKDEVDLIETTIAHLREIGIDVIIASDMGSTDGTLGVLERYRSDSDFMIIEHNEQTTTDEWSRTNLEVVKKVDVEWVTFVDADEYLLAATGSLRDCRALIDADVLAIDVFNIPLSASGPLMPRRLVVGAYDELSLIFKPIKDFRSYLRENPDSPMIRMEWGVKVMARPECIAAVGDGSHSVVPVQGAHLRFINPSDLLIAHLPFSTRRRFASKIESIRLVFDIHDEYMGEHLGWHWRHWLALAEDGRLDEEFNRNVFDTDTIAALRMEGVIRSAQEVFEERISSIAEVP